MFNLHKLVYNNDTVGVRFEDGSKMYDMDIETATSIGLIPKGIKTCVELIPKGELIISQYELDNNVMAKDLSGQVGKARFVYAHYLTTDVTSNVYANSNLSKDEIIEMMWATPLHDLHSSLFCKDKSFKGIQVNVEGETILLIARELYNILSFNKVKASRIPRIDISKDIDTIGNIGIVNYLYTRKALKGAIIDKFGFHYLATTQDINTLKQNGTMITPIKKSNCKIVAVIKSKVK